MKQGKYLSKHLLGALSVLSISASSATCAFAQQLTPEKQQEVDALSQQIKANPNDYSLYVKRGFIYKKAGKASVAEMDFEQALTLNPSWQQGLLLHADYLREKHDWIGAMNFYTKAIEIKPYPPAYGRRGSLYWDMKKFDEAKSDFSKAIQIDPNCQPAYAGRAGVELAQHGANEAALSDIKMAVKLNPADLPAKALMDQISADLNGRKN